LFEPYYVSNSPNATGGLIHKKMATGNKSGRKRKLDAREGLCLYLTWCWKMGSFCVLQMTFGMTAQSISVYLRFARRIILVVLTRHLDAMIRVPSTDKIREFQETIGIL